MRRQHIENSAFKVAMQVRAVEDSIELALTDLAELQTRMLRARAATGVGISTGHVALAKVADALQGLVSARGGMAECHQELLAAKQFVPGLRNVSFGDGDCPEEEPKKFAQLHAIA
jgi:hypothetical protein